MVHTPDSAKKNHRLLKPAQWVVLIVLSAIFGLVFTWLSIPAAMLLGPMLAGIIVSVNNVKLQPPNALYLLSQGVIGCMIASEIPLSVADTLSGNWMIFALCVSSVILVCVLLGWLMTRMRILPGSTALWGLSPGAATAMTLMAETHGADAQLVAVMQYLRVVMVAGMASVLMISLGVHTPHKSVIDELLTPVALPALAQTLGLIIVSTALAKVLRISAGAMLIPMIIGIVMMHHQWIDIQLPHSLLVIAYATIGWKVGLKFSKPLLKHAAKVLPRIAVSILILITICGGMAMLLVIFAGIDPLTAYMAMSPGGADSVAIIAASVHNVDIAFVMTMQMTRFIALLILGPVVAKMLDRHKKKRAANAG